MRYRSLVLLLLFPSLTFAEGPLTPRPLDPIAAEALARALERSPLVRALVGEIAASNVVVHVESTHELPSGIAGTTRFVTSGGGHRYVRISLLSMQPPQARAAILGHELQHVAEIARSGAADHAAVERLFTVHGYRSRGARNFFETAAAAAVEKQVRMELSENRTTRSAAPTSGTTPTRGVSRQVALPDK